MQLVYRGSSYAYPTSEIPSPYYETTGIYRGAAVKFRAPVGVFHPEAVSKLTYRGNSYLRIRGSFS